VAQFYFGPTRVKWLTNVASQSKRRDIQALPGLNCADAEIKEDADAGGLNRKWDLRAQNKARIAPLFALHCARTFGFCVCEGASVA